MDAAATTVLASITWYWFIFCIRKYVCLGPSHQNYCIMPCNSNDMLSSVLRPLLLWLSTTDLNIEIVLDFGPLCGTNHYRTECNCCSAWLPVPAGISMTELLLSTRTALTSQSKYRLIDVHLQEHELVMEKRHHASGRWLALFVSVI